MRARRRPTAPEWTDTNESDPGITLPQLFEFLTESVLYSVTRRRRVVFAGLLLVALWKLRCDRSE
jgi:hypothetical protein